MRSARRVAFEATAIVAIVYCLASFALTSHIRSDSLSSTRHELDEAIHRLAYSSIGSGPIGALVPGKRPTSGQIGTHGSIDPDSDLERVPVAFWWVANATAVADDSSVPNLPKRYYRTDGVVLGTIGGSSFSIAGAKAVGGRWVVAISNAPIDHETLVLYEAELVLLPIVLGAFFVVAYLVGRRAAAPIAESRKRLLNFTADASHELRTPISVIEAEVSSALLIERDGPTYKEVLKSVSRETRRLGTIVDELLWLARFDALPASPTFEKVDLATVARTCANRFSTLAENKNMTIEVIADGNDESITVLAPPEWLDRLITTLVDNACKYGPENSRVQIEVGGKRQYGPFVAVHDQGPGVSGEQRDRIFERFHRESDKVVGSGLGLAIADAVVRATGGRWEVGMSPLGGAIFKVIW